MSKTITSSLDEKGRVVIPQSIRDNLNIKPGEILIVSSLNNSIIIEPAHEKKLLHLEIGLSDEPGSLAKAAFALAKINVDLVSTSSRSSRRGEIAIWSVECNAGKISVSQIKSALSSVGAKILSSSQK
ncbi:MAG: AbrB/MazE/SpoVT family DNA-binding domain-containing protein [Candidatus Micrarchaeia archaeon]